MISKLKEDANAILLEFIDSTDYDGAMLAKNATIALTTLTDETMINLNATRVLFDDYKFYLINQVDLNIVVDKLDIVEQDLKYIDIIEENAKINLSGVLLVFSLIAMSYILMTVISYIINLISKLEFARIIKINSMKENKDIDDNDEFLRLD